MRSLSRIVPSAVAGILVLSALAGCSTSSFSTPDSTLASSALTVGSAAIDRGQATDSPTTPSAGSTPAPAPTTRAIGADPHTWQDQLGCPAAIKKGMTSVLPASIKVVTEEPSSVTGLSAAPGILQGIVPSCAFALKSGSVTKQELVFLGMPSEYVTTFSQRLTIAGFVAKSTTSSETVKGTATTYQKQLALVSLSNFQKSATVPFSYIVLTG